ncbi:MAG TPA: helix-turn-helix domain-containing protein [bacterium]|jgi:hypothetical protein|nr:helix-turn-helix domain-containing protein [bacterium]
MFQLNGSQVQERQKESGTDLSVQRELPGTSGSFCKVLWTVQDLAKFAQLSASKIYRDAEAGLIPCKRWGRTGQGKKAVLRFHPNEILAWLDAGCPVPRLSKALVEPPKEAKMSVRKTVGEGANL